MPVKLDLIKFVTAALNGESVRSLVPMELSPKVTAGEVLAIVQLVCSAAEVVCPVVQSLPTE